MKVPLLHTHVAPDPILEYWSKPSPEHCGRGGRWHQIAWLAFSTYSAGAPIGGGGGRGWCGGGSGALECMLLYSVFEERAVRHMNKHPAFFLNLLAGGWRSFDCVRVSEDDVSVPNRPLQPLTSPRSHTPPRILIKHRACHCSENTSWGFHLGDWARESPWSYASIYQALQSVGLTAARKP